MYGLVQQMCWDGNGTNWEEAWYFFPRKGLQESLKLLQLLDYLMQEMRFQRWRFLGFFCWTIFIVISNVPEERELKILIENSLEKVIFQKIKWRAENDRVINWSKFSSVLLVIKAIQTSCWRRGRWWKIHLPTNVIEFFRELFREFFQMLNFY